MRTTFAADKAISVQSAGDGILVRAGERPRLGERIDDLAAYRSVGSFVKGLRGNQEIELDGLTLKESKRWLARFDG